MGITVYERDDVVRLRATFLSYAREFTDPSAITLSVKDPNATTVHYYYASGTVTRDGTGIYHVDVNFNVTGRWTYRWRGSGTIAGATEDTYVDIRTTVF